MASKPLSEQASRQRLIEWAQQYGAVEELQKIFNRYDGLLKGARTEEERKAIQIMGVTEIHAYFDPHNSGAGELIVNGVRIK